MTRMLALLCLGTYLHAQTAQVPSIQVQLPAVVLPQMKCAVSGKTATCPQMTLLKASVSATAPVSAPVTLPQYTFSIQLTAAQLAQLEQAMQSVAAGQNASVTGVTITLTAVK